VGHEAECTATFGNQKSKGRAYLETDAIIFRGEFRLAIPYARARSVHAKDGRLTVRFADGVATFDLADRAHAWATKILHPKSLIDKLGVKSQDRVAVLGVTDADFLPQLRARTDSVMLGKVTKDLDAIFVQANRKAILARLTRLRVALKPAGSIWVVAPKGVKEITEADVLAAGRKAGLVDVKVVRFSDTHTAHKFVIPIARRRDGARR
jgi:hypothetical protein